MEIVGLKNFVQDDVDKLICKFVGVKPHPLALIVGVQIRHYNRFICENHPYPWVFRLDCPFMNYIFHCETHEGDSEEDED